MDIHIFDYGDKQIVVHDHALQEHINTLVEQEDENGYYVWVTPSQVASHTAVQFRGGIYKGVMWNHIPLPGRVRVEVTAQEGDSFNVLSCCAATSPLSVRIYTKSDPQEGRFRVPIRE